MKPEFYLAQFQIAAEELSVSLLRKTTLQAVAGIWLNSACIKILKKDWANALPDKNPSGPAIFFSIWISDKAIKENKIFYNIHAIKLRALNGYTIESRAFAAAFRKNFTPFEDAWPNISTAFGPQTLMEGWEKLNAQNPAENILQLTKLFLKIEFIIDGLLSERRKPAIQ